MRWKKWSLGRTAVVGVLQARARNALEINALITVKYTGMHTFTYKQWEIFGTGVAAFCGKGYFVAYLLCNNSVPHSEGEAATRGSTKLNINVHMYM